MPSNLIQIFLFLVECSGAGYSASRASPSIATVLNKVEAAPLSGAAVVG